jgi:hypothetical protein
MIAPCDEYDALFSIRTIVARDGFAHPLTECGHQLAFSFVFGARRAQNKARAPVRVGRLRR